MRFFFIKLIILGLAVLLFVQNPGDITVHWLGWHLSTTLGFFLIALLIFMLGLGLLASGWEGVKNFFKLLMSSHSARKRQKGRDALNAAFTALEVGANGEALALAEKASEYLPDHSFVGLALLKSGLSTHNRLAIRQGSEILRKFPALAPIPIYHSILEYIHNNQWDKAEAYILDALRDYPTQTVFLKLTLLKEVHLHQWEEAEAILSTLVGEKIYTKPYAKQIEGHIIMHRALKTKLPAPKKLDLLKRAYQLNPKSTIAVAYASALSSQNEYKQARKVLEARWKKEPSWAVAQLYCELEPQESALTQARHASALSKMVPGTPGRIVALIYLIRARVWGEARERLEKLTSTHAVKEIFLLALQKQNKSDYDKLCAHFKKALESAAAYPTISKEKYLEQLVLSNVSMESAPFITPAQLAEMVL